MNEAMQSVIALKDSELDSLRSELDLAKVAVRRLRSKVILQAAELARLRADRSRPTPPISPLHDRLTSPASIPLRFIAEDRTRSIKLNMRGLMALSGPGASGGHERSDDDTTFDPDEWTHDGHDEDQDEEDGR